MLIVTTRRPISIEEPLKVIPNVYELIHCAAYRARQLANGAKPKTDIGQSNFAVAALKEIAAGHTNFDEDGENNSQS